MYLVFIHSHCRSSTNYCSAKIKYTLTHKKSIGSILWNVCFTREFIDITCCWLQLKMHSNSDLIRRRIGCYWAATMGCCWKVPSTQFDCRSSNHRRLWHCKTFRDTNLSNYRVSSYLLHFSFLDSTQLTQCYVPVPMLVFVFALLFSCFIDDCNMLSNPLRTSVKHFWFYVVL